MGDGTRTRDFQSHSLTPAKRKSKSVKSCVKGESAHVLQHVPEMEKSADNQTPAIPPIDPNLAVVIDRWPALPDHVRQTVLTLIQTVSPH